MSDTFYIPIMCCGQEMAEIYEGEERVAATCSICGKVWKPGLPKYATWTICQIKIKIDPAMPKDQARLEGGNGSSVTLINIGDEKSGKLLSSVFGSVSSLINDDGSKDKEAGNGSQNSGSDPV